MGRYHLVYTKGAKKDLLQKVLPSPHQAKVLKLLRQLKTNPLQPPFETLKGDLQGFYSRRINIQHRLVYRLDGETVFIYSVWRHYE